VYPKIINYATRSVFFICKTKLNKPFVNGGGRTIAQNNTAATHTKETSHDKTTTPKTKSKNKT
jgi:hypothetical protein